MSKASSIITAGICPSWDIICRVDGLQWGEHKKLESQQLLAAGKALNISRALAWLKMKSVAAGLWGQSDYKQMAESLRPISDFVDIKFTKAPGQTRRNITVFDRRAGREIHLRAESKLASRESLKQLAADLDRIVDKDSIVVFAGSMPEGELLDDCLSMIAAVRDAGARVAVDTSGQPLKEIVRLGGIWLIKPNIRELRELLNKHVADSPSAAVKAARGLCDKVRIVVVSRGAKGAIAVTGDAALQAKASGRSAKALGTVGCGDYLLAGLLAGLGPKRDLHLALAKGIKVATARACGLTERMNWAQAERKIGADVSTL